MLLVVGDFNAWVGSSERGADVPVWSGMRGFDGVGKMNKAGVTPLSFCALNELTIENTCSEKKTLHKYTWQHPGSKQWHCIDYVIMRQKQRWLCRDVTVVRSVECWTDRKLLKTQLEL